MIYEFRPLRTKMTRMRNYMDSGMLFNYVLRCNMARQCKHDTKCKYRYVIT